MQPQHYRTGKQSSAPPGRHTNSGQRSKQAVRCARYTIGVEYVLPAHSQRPLRHDVGKDENRAQIFPALHICPCDQVSKDAAVQDRNHTGQHRQEKCVQERFPEIGSRKPARKQIGIVDHGVSAGLFCQIGINGAGVNLEGIPDNGNDRQKRGDRADNAKDQQNDAGGILKPDPKPVSHWGLCFLCMHHETVLSQNWAAAPESDSVCRSPIRLQLMYPLYAFHCAASGDHLVRPSIQLPIVQSASAQYWGSSSTRCPSPAHHSYPLSSFAG